MWPKPRKDWPFSAKSLTKLNFTYSLQDMNLLQRSAAVSLLATTSLLTGTPAEAAPLDSASLAEALGLPVDAIRTHFNKGTQTGIYEVCQLNSDKLITCNLDVLANEALIDYRQKVEYEIGENGGLSISTSVYDVGREWTPDTFDYKYKPLRDDAHIYVWSSQSPLAITDGAGRVVQNDAKAITLLSPESVDVMSVAPVNEGRGLEIHTIFDGARNVVQSYVVPRVSFDGAMISAQPQTNASRDMDYFSEDPNIMNRYIQRAQDAGGMAFRFPE